MSSIVPILLVVGGLAGGVEAQAVPCPAGALSVLAEAEEAVLAGEPGRASELLRPRSDEQSSCATLATASWSLRGWDAAREAAKLGGSVEALAPVRDVLTRLESWSRPGVTLEAYAAALVRAAVAASQQERAEMRVWLEHARTLSSRLLLIGEPSTWPRPMDLAEGELWLAVDDYEPAEAAFDAALVSRESVAALTGLGRTRAHRGNNTGACTAFKRAASIVPSVYRNGAVAVEAKKYARFCEQ